MRPRGPGLSCRLSAEPDNKSPPKALMELTSSSNGLRLSCRPGRSSRRTDGSPKPSELVARPVSSCRGLVGSVRNSGEAAPEGSPRTYAGTSSVGPRRATVLGGRGGTNPGGTIRSTPVRSIESPRQARHAELGGTAMGLMRLVFGNRCWPVDLCTAACGASTQDHRPDDDGDECFWIKRLKAVCGRSRVKRPQTAHTGHLRVDAERPARRTDGAN